MRPFLIAAVVLASLTGAPSAQAQPAPVVIIPVDAESDERSEPDSPDEPAPDAAVVPPPHEERSVAADLHVRRGDDEVSLSIEGATTFADDELRLRVRVPRQAFDDELAVGQPSRRGWSFEKRFAHALLGSLVASGVGAGIGLLVTVWSPETIGYGLLGGALFATPIGASVGSALGTRSDAGSFIGVMCALPVGWGLGMMTGIGAWSNGAPPEAGLAISWLVTTLLSVLVTSAWTELDDDDFTPIEDRRSRSFGAVKLRVTPTSLRVQF
ncbi:MAG: hypothetical protein ACFCGT_03450 [Sandaracinaceae bacterium]